MASWGFLAVVVAGHDGLEGFSLRNVEKMGRRSFLHVAVSGDVIEIGGHVVPVMRGLMEF